MTLPLGECSKDDIAEYRDAHKDQIKESERLTLEKTAASLNKAVPQKQPSQPPAAAVVPKKRARSDTVKSSKSSGSSMQVVRVVPGNNFWFEDTVDGKCVGMFQPTISIQRKTPALLRHPRLYPNTVFSCYDPDNVPVQVHIVKVGVWNSAQRVLIVRLRMLDFDSSSMLWEPSQEWQGLHMIDGNQVLTYTQTNIHTNPLYT